LRTIVNDYAPLEDAKIIQDDDKYLVVQAVIASEIVQQYSDGWAYKPAEELEKATWTAAGVPIRALAHPRGSHIDDVEDVNGRVENPRFRKDLIDPKTKRPCRRGIETHLKFFRANAPEVTAGPFKPIADATAEAIRKGELRDNSIGFSCNKDYSQGDFQGKHYDFVQRKILINHLAAPIPKGRCPSPYCGIAVDSIDEQDTWETTEESIRSGHGNKDKFDPDSFKTIDITEGIKAVVGCPKGEYENGKCKVGMETQSFIFDKTKFTMEEAKAWFTKHQTKDSAELEAYFKCPVCQKLDEIGVLEVGKRLIIAYGVDVMRVIEGKDEMSNEEIENKIKELYDKKDKLIEAQKKFYAVEKPNPEAEKLYRQIEDLDIEIKTYKELKIKKKVEGKDQPPKTDVERAKQHFGLSDEEWNALSEDEKKALIAKLPPAGTKRNNTTSSDAKDRIMRNRKALEDIKVFLDVF